MSFREVHLIIQLHALKAVLQLEFELYIQYRALIWKNIPTIRPKD